MARSFGLLHAGVVTTLLVAFAAVALVPIFSLAGVPPLSGFLGKLAILEGAFAAGAYWVGGLVLVVGLAWLIIAPWPPGLEQAMGRKRVFLNAIASFEAAANFYHMWNCSFSGSTLTVKLKDAATAVPADSKKGQPEPDLWSISAQMKSAISSAACNSVPAGSSSTS